MSLCHRLLDPGAADDVALVDAEGALTRGQLRDRATVEAQRLGAHGDGPILVAGGPDRESVIAYLGALLAQRQVHLGQTGSEQPAAAIVMYTSGSTREPVPVPLTTANLLGNAEAIISTLGLNAEDRVLCSMSLSYSFGLSLLHTALAAGACIALPSDAAHGIGLHDAVRKFDASVVGMVPSLARRFAQRRELLADVPGRMIQVAGGRLDTATARTLVTQLPEHVAVQVMYGLTEATARVTAFDLRQHPDKLGSVGRPIAGVSVWCEDDSGSPLAPGEAGSVVVRGAGVSRTFARVDGSLVTGDFGWVDHDGFLWLDGRDSDIVKVGGMRMSLAPVEEQLHSLPGVQLAAAVPIRDDLYGERVAAVVVLEPACSTTAQQLLDHLGGELPRLLTPVTVRIVDTIPLTSNGKVDRRETSRLFDTLPSENRTG